MTEQAAQSTPPNCRKCIHRRCIPGDAHSRCAHPVLPDDVKDPFNEIMAIFASVGRSAPMVHAAALELGITAKEAGIRKGWFNWPWNFDPVWLVSCNGFDPRSKATSQQGE